MGRCRPVEPADRAHVMSDLARAKSCWPTRSTHFRLFPDSRRILKWKRGDSNYRKAFCRRMNCSRSQSNRATRSTLTCVKHKSSVGSKLGHIAGINHRLILGWHSAKLPRSVMNLSPILCALVAPAAAGPACFGMIAAQAGNDGVRPSQNPKDKSPSSAEARLLAGVSVGVRLINQGSLH